MTPDEVTAFLGPAHHDYVQQRIAAGEHPDDAARIARQQIEELFPGGTPGADQHLYAVVAEGAVVGSLWIGRRPGDRPTNCWVYDIVIAEEYRGRGLGRAAMELAEQAAADHGATVLGLNVFGQNVVARNLYESLGYRTTAVQMQKFLVPE